MSKTVDTVNVSYHQIFYYSKRFLKRIVLLNWIDIQLYNLYNLRKREHI